MSSTQPKQPLTSRKKPRWLANEDLAALTIGSTILILGLILSFFTAFQDLNLPSQNAPERQTLKNYNLTHDFLYRFTGKPGTWEYNLFQALLGPKEESREKYRNVMEEYQATWDVNEQELQSTFNGLFPKSFNHLPWLLALMVTLGLIFGLAVRAQGVPFAGFLKGFVFVFLIAIIAYLLAGQQTMKAIGFGYAAWAIIIGLLISNTVGTPGWILSALKTELFIKTGLVLLGAEVLLGKIMAIGLPGIFVAWVVTPIVLISTYWFGQRILKIGSKTLNMTISADMSVCGVSAAVATAAACKASKEELTLAIGLSMVFTSIMMIALPPVIHFFGMPEILGGAWLGGTIDSTGAVVAAGAFLGEKALYVAATIKMIQNILIGVIAFGVAVYFTSSEDGASKVGWNEIWIRFPKFILGFLGASVMFSILSGSMTSDMATLIIEDGTIGSFSKNIRGWLFCLAFASIGLSTNFKSLSHQFKGGKPLILYICGQSLNLILTLIMAYVMFYLVFRDITESI